MSLQIVLVIFFAASFALLASGIHLLLELPKRRRLRTRLEAVGQLSHADLSLDARKLLSSEVVKQSSPLDWFFSRIPGAGQLERILRQANLRFKSSFLIALSLTCSAVAMVLSVVARLPWVAVAGISLLTFTLPFFYVAYRRHTRLRKFEELFPESLDMLARAVRAGYAFTSGLELIAREMPEPIATEFQITYDQQNLGLPMREVLKKLTERVPLADVRIFAVLLRLQQESGGNLAEMLDNLSAVVRERFKLLRQVRVFTAEGRMSMVVLSLLPPVAAGLFLMTNREYIMPLFTDPMGQQMLAFGAVMQVVGVLLIRRIVHIKV